MSSINSSDGQTKSGLGYQSDIRLVVRLVGWVGGLVIVPEVCVVGVG